MAAKTETDIVSFQLDSKPHPSLKFVDANGKDLKTTTTGGGRGLDSDGV